MYHLLSLSLQFMFPCFCPQCTPPYVGDGSLCVLDSDGDGYPALALRTCSDEDTEMYCMVDTCPTAPNTNQSDTSFCSGTAQTGTWNIVIGGLKTKLSVAIAFVVSKSSFFFQLLDQELKYCTHPLICWHDEVVCRQCSHLHWSFSIVHLSFY